jgi:hypothetical protein
MWADKRRTHGIVRALHDILIPADQEKLESWARNVFPQEVRPPVSRSSPALRLADAATSGWRHVTFTDAD